MQQKRTTKKIIVIAAYRPPCLSKSLWTQDLGDLLLRTRNRYDNIMVVGDLNCDLSDPDKHDKQGRALLDLMEVYNMSNMIKQPTRVTTSSSSLIDVILTTSPRLFSTSGVFDLDLSDHKLVYTIMRTHCPRRRRRIVIKRRFKNYVSESFCEDVSRIPFYVASVFDDIDDICWAWTKLLSDVVEDHAPIKRSTVRREHVPYMSPELLDAIRLRNKLKKHFSKTNDPAYPTRIQRNLTTSLRRKIIVNYLKDKANDAKGDPKQFWNTIKPLMHCNKVTQREAIHLKEGDEMITEKEAIANIFSRYFSEVHSCDKTSEEMTVDEYFNSNHPSISAILRENSTVQQFEFRNVEAAEIVSILKSLDPKKATGHDTIPARPLRDCATIIASPLAVLINKIITSAYVPVDWKLAELCPIFKKDDVLDKTKYRPVSILVLLDKIFEKCLNHQLTEHFSIILSPFLSAYRKDYNCEAVLLRLIEDWRMDLDKKKTAGIVSMDLSKAFDLIPHNLLLAKLAAYGIRNESLTLLQSYLQDRSQRVKIENITSDSVSVTRGVPQGSVLGPLLFNVFLNDLFYFIKVAKLSNYADDNQLYSIDLNPAVVEETMKEELKIASTWFSNNNLTLNPDKCKAMVISNNTQMDD